METSKLIRGFMVSMMLLLASCGSDQETSIALEETNWELMELTVLGGFIFVPDEPGNYRINFRSNSRLTGISDCNNLNGRWLQEGSSLVFEGLDAKWMMCPPGSLHNNFVLYLRQVSSLMMEDGNLVLTTPTEGVKLAFRPAQ